MVWPFNKQAPTVPAPVQAPPTPPAPESYDVKWKKDMLDRWVDLEARVTALEIVDKEYKKQVRRVIKPAESEDLKSSVLVPV